MICCGEMQRFPCGGDRSLLVSEEAPKKALKMGCRRDVGIQYNYQWPISSMPCEDLHV